MALHSDIALLVGCILATMGPVAMEKAPAMNFKPRIVGGTPANIADYPFTVSVQVQLTHTCGASLVSKLVVLTAAHCFYDPSTSSAIEINGPEKANKYLYSCLREIQLVARTSANACLTMEYWPNNRMTVLAGSTVSDTTTALTKMQIKETIQRRLVRELLPAPGHVALSDGGGGPDVGLIIVDSPFQFTLWVQPAPLPSVGEADAPPPAGTVCQTMGWGHKDPVPSAQQKEDGAEEPPLYPSLVLNVVDLPILEFNKCTEYYETLDAELHLCTLAKEKDACNGDSGGPMVCEGKQVAIVMAGDGCAQPDSPGAFSRLATHLGWIRSVVESSEKDEEARGIGGISEKKGRAVATTSYPTTIFNLILTCALLTLCH